MQPPLLKKSALIVTLRSPGAGSSDFAVIWKPFSTTLGDILELILERE